MTLTNELTRQLYGLADSHITYIDQTTKPIIGDKSDSKALGIHNQMLVDYQSLISSAKKASIEIKIASGFRSFERQLMIWNNKFTGKAPIKNIDGESIDISKLSEYNIIEAILLFSALPGASRHHWGCDIDIYSPNLLDGKILQLEPWEYALSGPMGKLSSWLTDNASKFGFFFPYDKFRGGISAEPWHLSYAPIAQQYQSSFNLDSLKELLLNTDIAGKDAIIENLQDIFRRFISNVNNNH
jgi:LAS superfamily LD-carboxypeptidase LdcB